MFDITFSDYQAKTKETAIYRNKIFNYVWEFEKYYINEKAHDNLKGLLKLYYVILGLSGEASELCNKAKKIIRDDNGIITEEKKKELSAELGDLIWYCASLANELNIDLGQIAVDNIKKLADRKQKGTLNGSGDLR